MLIGIFIVLIFILVEVRKLNHTIGIIKNQVRELVSKDLLERLSKKELKEE